MRNVKTEVKNDMLVITVDLKSPRTVSASGKSEVIATTEGNVDVENTVVPGLKIGLNVYVKASAAK